MSNNCSVDVTFANNDKDFPLRMETNEKSISFIANFGKLVNILYSEEILLIDFVKGQIRIEIIENDIYKYLDLKNHKMV